MFNTFYILILSEIILFPIRSGGGDLSGRVCSPGRFVTIIHFAAETLAGVPSLVLGLFGVTAFSTCFIFGTSRMSGALTLLCLNFPWHCVSLKMRLALYHGSMREGGLALGATKWHTIRTVVLPVCITWFDHWSDPYGWKDYW